MIDIIIIFLWWHIIATFGLSIGYHRYFSHQTFKTTYAWEIIFLICGEVKRQIGIKVDYQMRFY